MQNKSFSFRELELQFKSASDIEMLNNVLKKYLNTIGVHTFSFTYYSYYPNALNKLKYDFSSDNFAEWHHHYIAEHYEEIDTTLDTAYLSTLPVYKELAQQLKEAKTIREKQMRLDGIAFGGEKSLSIPIHGPNEDFAIFLVMQMKGESCLEKWEEKQYDFFIIGYYYFSYLQRLLLKIQQPQEKYNLNKRDIQCLQLLAKQFSIPEMAKALHITPRTVNYHIHRLNKKLGTKNKHQSVIKAIQQKLIS